MAAFGELLVDVVWSVDAELDEVTTEVKPVEGKAQGDEAKEKEDQEMATSEPESPKAKDLLAALVKSLVVRIMMCRSGVEH